MPLIKSLFLFLLGLIAFNAHAIDQIYNWNGLEFVRSGNAHHVHPASPQSTVLRGGWILDISDVEPKASASHAMPYKNSSNALVTVKPQIDPKKVSSRVAQGLKNAAAGAATTGNGYVALGALACGLFDCGSAIVALADWGIDQLKNDGSGDFGVPTPDPNAVVSNGWEYRSGGETWYPSSEAACQASAGWRTNSTRVYKYESTNDPFCILGHYGTNGTYYGSTTYSISAQRSSCTAGNYVVNGSCVSDAPSVNQSLETYLDSRYMGKGWDHHWAKMTAAIVAAGGNVFTDGTSTDITGPAIVPVSTSETKTSVSLVPGTTTPAPSGHTGPTESGTQTTTTTTTAHNKYNPAPMTSGSSGSPASGPSMETTQKTTTTTTITNNVTNITNIVNETTTEKDEAPAENATDTPLSAIPELYKQKYPDGLTGVFNDFKNRINTTSFVQLISALTPNISGAGTCPSWTIDLTWTPGGSMGRHTIGPDICWIWPILKIIVMVTTLFTVRRLIFGFSTAIGSFSQLPAEILNILMLLGFGEAMVIIGSALLIRFGLQLIPFVRLGS